MSFAICLALCPPICVVANCQFSEHLSFNCLCRQNICLVVFCVHIDHTDLERYGYTALMLAAQGSWFPVVERLLQEERIDLDKVGVILDIG